jgi:hypothetical protein
VYAGPATPFPPLIAYKTLARDYADTPIRFPSYASDHCG